MPQSPDFLDLLLAFRKAKTAIASERGVIGLLQLANFEMKISSRIGALEKALADDRWFDSVDIGRIVIVPKPTSTTGDNPTIVEVGTRRASPAELQVRLQLEPSPEFAVVECAYLASFGPALEALLDDDMCLGYRLKLRRSGDVDPFGRYLYRHWQSAFRSYRDDPVKAARSLLEAEERVTIISTDIVSFFDCVDPSFLLDGPFISRLETAATRLNRPFHQRPYRRATLSLLNAYARFRAQRKRFGATLDTKVGVPIGSLTSRVVANLALAGLDDHIRSRRHVALYRRYVDDMVIVTTEKRPKKDPKRNDILSAIFPNFSEGSQVSSFETPDTHAKFGFNNLKTRIHRLRGEPGLEFLNAVRESFSLVSSERRAFLGNVDRLESEIETVALFDTATQNIDRIPRLRDADRFTLRRFTATTLLKGLQRHAVLLSPKLARAFLQKRTQRLLSAMDGGMQLDDFEFALSLLKVALLCDCEPVITRINNWLGRHTGTRLRSRITSISWMGQHLDEPRARNALDEYLERRIREGVASACTPRVSEDHPVPSEAAGRDARLLRRAGLRHLDREDDVSLFGTTGLKLSDSARREHRTAMRRAGTNKTFRSVLHYIRLFIERTIKCGDDDWRDTGEIGLLLTARPPRYLDIARRFLVDLEDSTPSARLGITIDACARALRGSGPARPDAAPTVSVHAGDRGPVVTVGDPPQPNTVRVILGNLPVGGDAFKAAALGKPIRTTKRLQTLDRILRDARRAARDAARDGIPSILVLPELSIPRRWVRSLAEHAAAEEISIVAGVEYRRTKNGLANEAIGIFPNGLRRTWKKAAFVQWTKQYPSHREGLELSRLGQKFSVQPREEHRLLVNSVHGRIGVLICSEILQASALATLAGAIELLLVPAWNDDTPSFEHVAHSASLLVHAFVGIANNAEASDSRIVAPIKEPRHERDWCRLIQRGESQIVWGDLPTAELLELHRQGPAQAAAHDKRPAEPTPRQYRPLPPDV